MDDHFSQPYNAACFHRKAVHDLTPLAVHICDSLLRRYFGWSSPRSLVWVPVIVLDFPL